MKLIDLTHAVYTGMPSIPSDKHVTTEIKEISNINNDGIERHQILMSCHSGTHIDSPIHMVKDGITLDKIPLEYLIGKSKKIKLKKEENEAIDLNEIKDYDLNNLDFLIFQTSWEKRCNKKDYYFNHPYISQEAITYLASTKLKGLLIDTPNPDKFDDHNYPIHKIWFASKSVLVENVCNLDMLGNDIYNLIIAPLNLNAEAAPARIFIFPAP